MSPPPRPGTVKMEGAGVGVEEAVVVEDELPPEEDD